MFFSAKMWSKLLALLVYADFYGGMMGGCCWNVAKLKCCKVEMLISTMVFYQRNPKIKKISGSDSHQNVTLTPVVNKK